MVSLNRSYTKKEVRNIINSSPRWAPDPVINGEITPINGLVSGYSWGDISPRNPWRCHFTLLETGFWGPPNPRSPGKSDWQHGTFLGADVFCGGLKIIQHIKSKTCTKKKLKNTDQATKIWYLITSFYGLPEALGKMDLQPQSGVNGCISPWNSMKEYSKWPYPYANKHLLRKP